MRRVLGIGRSLLTYYGIPGRLGQLRRFYGQFIRAGDLCFDIGSHVGNRLLPWSRLGATVIAVEPQPQLMQLLRRFYGRSPQITLIEKAVGAASGRANLHISSRFPTVTTLSMAWITAVQKEPSFAKVRWDQTIEVPVTTLDEMIAQFGLPAFCKIDVEGFEYEVLKGLSSPIQALSFEYIAAAPGFSINCISHLMTLGQYEFNWSAGESHRFNDPHWVEPKEMISLLKTFKNSTGSGDIYARLKKPNQEPFTNH